MIANSRNRLGNSPRRLLLVGLPLLLLAGGVGCAYNSPFRHTEWADEEKFGATFNERLDVVRDLANDAKHQSPQQQQQISADLARRLSQEPNMLMRLELVRTLGAFKTDASMGALRVAINDSSSRVRSTACDSLGRIGGIEATQLLAHAAEHDADDDVRIAAVRSLGQCGNGPDTTQALAGALDDANPALQYRAMQSLAHVSGKNYGNDVVAWKNYTRTVMGDQEQSIATQPGYGPPPSGERLY